MANLMHAVARFGPRLRAGPPVADDELASQVSAGTGASSHMARMMLAQLSDALLFFLRRGSAVHVPGIGRFRTTISRDGRLRLHLVPDKGLIAALQDREQLSAKVEHAERIGWSDAQYKAEWDAVFPLDPLDIAVDGRPRRRRLTPGRPWTNGR
jgi:hypothetical protein